VTARRAVVLGRVQGVGFRYFAVRAARELGVAGWVRNLPDGSVETLVEGEEAAVELYLERLKQGPSASRVERVAVEDRLEEGLSSFEIAR
jgi:acylphosphatase